MTGAEEPVRLIYDTDMGNDVDDALALAVIHALESRGACRLLAVTVTKDHDLAAPFCDAVNTFYGRGDVPIGMVHGGFAFLEGRFLSLVAQRDNGSLRYPHDLLSGDDAPKAIQVLRQTLAAQPDASVVIIQVGFSTNLARLLESTADEYSPLPGGELVAQKVRHLSAMAGVFAEVEGVENPSEYNVRVDIDSAQQLTEDWPTPVVFSGFEVGYAIRYPADTIDQDYAYLEHHILAQAYRLHNPDMRDQPLYDLTSVLYAVHPDGGYFDLSPPGWVTISGEGLSLFQQDPEGMHRYLEVSEAQILLVRETLVELCTQPPDNEPSQRLPLGAWPLAMALFIYGIRFSSRYAEAKNGDA